MTLPFELLYPDTLFEQSKESLDSITTATKFCKGCGAEKPANTDNFYKHTEGKLRLDSLCKDCRKEKNKEWRENNKGYLEQSKGKYYQANRESILEKK